MTFAALNSAHNITVADAKAFTSKLAKLGLVLGDLHVNQQAGAGAENADYVPVTELTIEDGAKVCLIAWYGADWHNIAGLKLVFGAGGTEGLAAVASRLGQFNKAQVLLNVPGAVKAIDKLIGKA